MIVALAVRHVGAAAFDTSHGVDGMVQASRSVNAAGRDVRQRLEGRVLRRLDGNKNSAEKVLPNRICNDAYRAAAGRSQNRSTPVGRFPSKAAESAVARLAVESPVKIPADCSWLE